MRILLALTVFTFACGGSRPTHESAIVNEGSDVSTTCCCKTLPLTDEKEITPAYDVEGRMECSAAKGDCVDDIQCENTGDAGEASEPGDTETKGGAESDGVPPPATIEPDSTVTP